MVSRVIDELGNTYGKLAVVAHKKGPYKIQWILKCNCGSDIEVIATGSNLRRGCYTSCGCAKQDKISSMADKNRITGESKSREAYILKEMIKRCCDPTSESYPYYGGRGIKVCSRWAVKPEGIVNFIEDMGRAPSDMWIERVSSKGDYCPENCVWDTVSNQQFNRKKFENNTSGATGITICPNGNWKASIQHNGKRVSKTFKTFEEALLWRKTQELFLFNRLKPEHTGAE